MSEEPVQQEKEAAASGGGTGAWEAAAGSAERKKQRRRKAVKSSGSGGGEQSNDNGDDGDGGDGCERQREHPFIVTEPGEVARGKKNGLDYLFHLYEQCRQYLIQVQNMAKDKGEKCPTKVLSTNVSPSPFISCNTLCVLNDMNVCLIGSLQERHFTGWLNIYILK